MLTAVVRPDRWTSPGLARARMACLAGILVLVLAAPAAAQVETVLSGLDGPVDFAVLPDGTIWWIEYYSGNVTRYDPETGEREVLFHVDPVVGGERGLVGLGVNQATADKGTFFLYYTVADPGDKTGGINRLSRIDNGKETILLTTTSDIRHNGGRILIQSDGSLFVSTGENDLGAPAQDPDSLLGKILHLLPDGSPAPGNVQGRTYSLGHRNVYGLAYDPISKRLFATENNNAERDEVNEILPGRNYGWPACEGLVQYDYKSKDDQKPTTKPCDDPAYTEPIGEFYPTTTAAPTGAAILDGRLYWASWNEGSIHRLVENADGTWTDIKIHQYGGRINDLEAGPDGKSLYYSNWTHILRLKVEAPTDVPRLAVREAGDPVVLLTPTPTGNDRGSPAGSPALVLLACAAAGVLQARWRRRD